MADAKVSALTEISAPVLADYTYAVLASGPTSKSMTLSRAGGVFNPILATGRLTLTTGKAVTDADVTAAGTIYYTDIGNDGTITGNPFNIVLYDGTRLRQYSSAQISLALTVTSGKNYDVFMYDNAGTLTLELSAAWTNDTTRADALAGQSGIVVKSGAATRRWLGTIRASAANVTEDSGGGSTTQVGGKRFVWNAYNQVARSLKVIDTTANWSYTSATWRQEHGASGNKVEFVAGSAFAYVDAQYHASVYLQATNQSGSRAAVVGVGLDSVTSPTGARQAGFLQNSGSALITVAFYSALGARYSGYPGLGYHYLAPLERGEDVVSNCLFIGDNGDGQQTALFGSVFA